jgi:hypothetical protein
MIIHGLPNSTQISKQLPKKAIFDKFKPKSEDRKLFDEQISRLAFIAEISPRSMNIAVSGSVSAIFVIHATLKTSECDKKNILLLSKLIEQNMLFVLEYEEKARLVVCYAGKMFQTAIKPLDELEIKLLGNNLDSVWETIIADIGKVDVSEELTLAEQIAVDDERQKLLAKIERLEKKEIERKIKRRLKNVRQ